KPRRLA
ncbi:hypothetical protein BN1723_018014, partial [Verticillium longisporum]